MQDYDKTNIFARLAFLIGDIYSYFAVSWGHMGWRLRTWGRLSISSWANILHCVGLNYLHSIGRGKRIASAWAIHVFAVISRMIVSLLSTASLFTFSFFHFSFFYYCYYDVKFSYLYCNDAIAPLRKFMPPELKVLKWGTDWNTFKIMILRWECCLWSK